MAQRATNVSGAAICAVVMELSTPSARDEADGDAKGAHNRQAGEAEATSHCSNGAGAQQDP